MLDNFRESQFVAYTLLSNSILNGKLSHAYLINANNYNKVYDFVLAFVKMIICKNSYSNEEKCGSCNICKRIDDNNYPEVKIIESNSFVIKKEQLLELQSEFSTSSIEGRYRIYIIKDCDKMNKQASNCLLKFLEEPNDGIIAILVTNRLPLVISTIVSRCQLINLNSNKELMCNSALENLALLCCDNQTEVIEFVSASKNEELIDNVISFLDYFEENGLDTLIYMKKLWYNKIKERDDFESSLLLMLYFYYDALKCKIGTEQFFFCDKETFIRKVADNNSVEKLIKKMSIVNDGVSVVKFNLNLNLLIDDIVIRLGEV